MGAKLSSTFQISGIQDPILSNVQTRLEELVQNKPLRDYTDSELNTQIEKALYPYGFFNPSIQILRSPAKKLRFVIVPGSPLIIRHFSFEMIGDGQTNLALKKMGSKTTLKTGQPFNSIQYEAFKEALFLAAEKQGYLHAAFDKAELLINKRANTAEITLVFNTGPQFFFGQVQFDPTTISPELLRRYIPFAYGALYSSESLTSFNDHLVSSGYFKRVDIKPLPSSTTLLPLQVQLEPVPKTNYSLGVGFGTDTGIRGRAGMQVVPVNSAGHKFSLAALGSFRENGIQSQYIIPGNDPLKDQYEIGGTLANLNYDTGSSNSLLVSFAKRHNTAHSQRILSLNNLYERFDYSYQPRQEKVTFFPKASLSWFHKSNELFSPSGYSIRLNGLLANKAVLSDISFTQVSIDAKAAYLIEAMRTRLYFHTIQGITQIQDINQFPLSLSLLLGGSDNLKGYEYNSIGPGKILTYGGFELQKEIRDNWYLTGFIDTGDVYNPTVKLLKNDIGLGLMWISPIGPIKIGVAQPVDSHFHRMPHRNPQLVIAMGPDL